LGAHLRTGKRDHCQDAVEQFEIIKEIIVSASDSNTTFPIFSKLVEEAAYVDTLDVL
jgi:hypothetical protein